MGITFIFILNKCTLTLKCLAWGVKLQRLNLNRLAGVCLNGGACGLIRQSTLNLTNVLKKLNVLYRLYISKIFLLVLHGCRQSVLWNVLFIYKTDETFYLNFIKIFIFDTLKPA